MNNVVGTATLALACAVLAACNPSTTSTPTSTTAGTPAFVPCRDIPDNVVQSFGGKPETEKQDAAGVHISGYEICSWDTGSWYAVSVITATSIDNVRRSPRWVNATTEPVTIAGRAGEQNLESVKTTPYDCAVLFPTSAGGAVTVSVLKEGDQVADEELGKRRVEQPCPMLADVAAKLVPVLPK